MKVLISKGAPSVDELIEALNSKFSNTYSIQLSGIGNEKNIIVRKTMFVGAEISRRENEIQVEPIFPSKLVQLLRSLLLFGAGDLGIIRWIVPSKWTKLERDLSRFIDRKFH